MNILDKVNGDIKETIIKGDLNINYLNTGDHRILKDNIALLELNQIVNKPSRVTKDSETLIDIILTDLACNLCFVNVILPFFNNHDIIGSNRKV